MFFKFMKIVFIIVGLLAMIGIINLVRKVLFPSILRMGLGRFMLTVVLTALLLHFIIARPGLEAAVAYLSLAGIAIVGAITAFRWMIKIGRMINPTLNQKGSL